MVKNDLKNLEKVADLSFINRENTIPSPIKSPRKLVKLKYFDFKTTLIFYNTIKLKSAC